MEFSIDKRRKLTTCLVLGGEVGHCDLAQLGWSTRRTSGDEVWDSGVLEFTQCI